ncbi:MAG: nitrite reductase large subunit, partial [Alteraurantiacibacter sp.]|nr:nitrite reductase large subunit [Alteraurantiacibacter sp.]
VDSGYELHVAGNGGMKVRATDLLCKVATEQEVLEICAAFIQLYREQAHYLERTAHWIERVGLEHVRSALFDDPRAIGRLAARFRHSQTFMQEDPWAKRAAGEDARLHQHLAQVRPYQPMEIKQ